jgi:hypothetical protein
VYIYIVCSTVSSDYCFILSITSIKPCIPMYCAHMPCDMIYIICFMFSTVCQFVYVCTRQYASVSVPYMMMNLDLRCSSSVWCNVMCITNISIKHELFQLCNLGGVVRADTSDMLIQPTFQATW